MTTRYAHVLADNTKASSQGSITPASRSLALYAFELVALEPTGVDLRDCKSVQHDLRSADDAYCLRNF